MRFVGGLPETPCGAGSTLAGTAVVRHELPILLRDLNVGILLDAPCGDFNWMAHTDLSSVHYAGVDREIDHVAAAMARKSQPAEYAPKSKTILWLDIAKAALPRADLILSRDFLQHLPNDTVRLVLRVFKASGAPWLLATSHDAPANEDIARPGDFRRLNLCLPPFSLPAPTTIIDDGLGRILGLWPREALP